MNSLIEWLNVWGGRCVDFALPILWQSSVLIVAVFAFDVLLRRKVRASVRYSLWFVVFVKLLVPPTLALPTGAAWWLRSRPVLVAAPHTRMISVNYTAPTDAYVSPTAPLVQSAPPAPTLSRKGWALLVAAAVSGILALWVGFRLRQIARCLRRTTAGCVEVSEMLSQARQLAGVGRGVKLRVTSEAMSPAVCGLFQPVILLPQSLIEKLTASQLRAVLLHELIHLRRCDVWVNCAQTLLQIVYWWHPLLWIANARVRRVREEAVDDAVMYALSAEAEVYAPTLLEVAKLAFARPLASLGLVGILESRSALRHRIERLLNFTTPRRAGVSVVSVICLAAFTALAVPMGEPPARPAAASDDIGAEKLIPYHAKVDSEVFTRNILARAEGTLHTTNDNLNEILVSIMDGFNVDCRDERAINFNRATGEVTTRNTGEALQVLDEVVRELNLKGGEIVLNPPYGLKQVLIEGHFYLMKPQDVAKLPLAPESLHREGELSPWWELSAEDSTNFQQRLKELGLEPMMRPRIQTSHGVTAEMSMGDGTNNIRLACVPYVRGGKVDFTILARTTGSYAPSGKGWPDIAGHTNCAIFSRVSVPNGGAAILRAEQAGADSELVVLLTARIVKQELRVTGELPSPRRGSSRSPTNDVPLLGDLPGVGRLFKSPSNASGYQWYKTNFTESLSPVVQLVQEGKLLYQQGRMDEAELKLQEALAKDPNNQAAQYYLSLIEQIRARNMEPPSGLRNVPGPGTRPDDVTSLAQKVQYENGGADNSAHSRLPVPNPYAHTNVIYTSPQRQNIYQKLNSIVFENIGFTNEPLSTVIRELTEQIYRRDADQEGINFILNKTRPPAANAVAASTPQFDPTTGQPISEAGPEFDLAAVRIDLNPGLKNVRLLDVLEAITKSADHPINYALVDYGIEFNARAPGPELHTRTFRVDPNTFYAGLQKSVPNAANQGQVNGFNSHTDVQIAVIGFFQSIGVNLAAPKSVFFNDRQGTLTVRATDGDLETIEKALDTLNVAPAQVTVKVRAVEIRDEDMFKPEFEWFLKMIAANSSKNPVGVAGIITEPLFQTFLKRLEQRQGVDLLSEAEVTTLSGRDADIQLNLGVTNNNLSLDIVANVAADGYTIQMKLTPTMTYYLNDKGETNSVMPSSGGIPITGQLPIPRSRVHQVVTDCVVWDAQTAVLPIISFNGQNKTGHVVLLVTPVIIDPAGNRKNPPATLLFSQKPVPDQPAH